MCELSTSIPQRALSTGKFSLSELTLQTCLTFHGCFKGKFTRRCCPIKCCGICIEFHLSKFILSLLDDFLQVIHALCSSRVKVSEGVREILRGKFVFLFHSSQVGGRTLPSTDLSRNCFHLQSLSFRDVFQTRIHGLVQILKTILRFHSRLRKLSFLHLVSCLSLQGTGQEFQRFVGSVTTSLGGLLLNVLNLELNLLADFSANVLSFWTFLILNISQALSNHLLAAFTFQGNALTLNIFPTLLTSS